MKHFIFHPRGSVPAGVLVSMTTGYDYVGAVDGTPVDDAQAAKVEALERDVYDKLFPHAATRLRVQAIMGACLTSGSGSGSSSANKLFLFLGKVADGKTAFTSGLVKSTLGEYYGTLDSHKWCAGLLENRKRKLVVMENAPVVDASTMKLLTRGENLVFRKLYSNTVEMAFYPKLLMVSNTVPRLSGMAEDAFTMHWMYPVDFVSTFDPEAKQDDPVNFVWMPQNSVQLDEYYKEQAPYHMLLMLKYARRFIQDGRRLPA